MLVFLQNFRPNDQIQGSICSPLLPLRTPMVREACPLSSCSRGYIDVHEDTWVHKFAFLTISGVFWVFPIVKTTSGNSHFQGRYTMQATNEWKLITISLKRGAGSAWNLWPPTSMHKDLHGGTKHRFLLMNAVLADRIAVYRLLFFGFSQKNRM